MAVNWFHPTLAILGLDVDSAAGFAEVRARPKGFFAFILNLLGLGKEHRYTVDSEGFHSTTTSPTSEKSRQAAWHGASDSTRRMRFRTAAPVGRVTRSA